VVESGGETKEEKMKNNNQNDRRNFFKVAGATLVAAPQLLVPTILGSNY
jgi:hypothetical protein